MEFFVVGFHQTEIDEIVKTLFIYFSQAKLNECFVNFRNDKYSVILGYPWFIAYVRESFE